MKKNMLNNKIFIYLIFLFTFIIYNTFLNSYIIIKQNYSERMLKYAGFCEPFGYGFLQFIYTKYNIKFNFDIINFNNLPNIGGFFFKFNNKNDKKYLALIGISDDELNSNYLKKYRILEKNKNCYFLIKK